MDVETRDMAIGHALNADAGINGVFIDLVDEFINDCDDVFKDPSGSTEKRLMESHIKRLALQEFKDKLTELKEKYYV